MTKKTIVQIRRGIGIPAMALAICIVLLAGCSGDDGFGSEDSEPVAVNFTTSVSEVALPQNRVIGSETRAVSQQFTGINKAGVPYRDYRDTDGFNTRAFYPGMNNKKLATTRTTNGGNSWDTGDKVGIFMLNAGSLLSGTPLVVGGTSAVNRQYSVNPLDGKLTPTDNGQLYFPQTGEVDFVAYYPYTNTTGNNPGEITTDYKYTFTVAGQDSEEEQNAMDLLYAKSANVARQKTSVELSFNHVLSKVTLNVTLSDGSTDGSEITAVTFNKMPLTATLDLQDGTLAAGTKESFTALKATSPVGGATATFTALLVPQPTGDTDRTVVFTVAGADYTWTIPDAEAFAAGNHYTYPLKVQRNGIVVAGAPAITPWTTNPQPSGTAEIVPIETVKIPAGTFLMGSSNGSNIGDNNGSGLNTTPAEPSRFDRENQHWVTLTKDFYMGKYEITNTQYAAFLNANDIADDGIWAEGRYPSQQLIKPSIGYVNWSLIWDVDKWVPVSGYENHPVIFVTWYGAVEYAHWIGGSLPTEAQWEYACRGGQTESLPFGIGTGTKMDGTMANISRKFIYELPEGQKSDPAGIDHNITDAVGSYPYTNGWGLYDMHGNVMEWCADWYSTDNRINATDPTGPVIGTGRVVRGSAWGMNTRSARSAFYDYKSPDTMVFNTGFRVVFVP